MGQKGAWERSGQLSRIFLDYNCLYLDGEADDDDIAVLRWRRALLDFLEGLLSSCRGREDDGSSWIHFHFEPVRSVINHSCCDWASPTAFISGLMAEVVRALIKVQSKLPVSTPAILHVLLHRLAALSYSKEIVGRYSLLVSGLVDTLDACPAMPSETLAASLDDCLRRPSAAATWSMRATPVLVRGVLSLVTRSPRSLCRAVVPVLVRFVIETECGMALPSSSADSSSTESQKKLSPRRTRCSSCVAVGWHRATDVPDDPREPRPLRCATQETRDIVLQGLLRWVVEAHFRECSALLQTSLHRAVCDGTQLALDACAMATGRVSLLHFPLACKLLLSLVGRVAGDGGGNISLFFRELCAAELRCVLSRPEVCTPLRNSKGTRRHALKNDEQDFLVLPVLEGYVGHLCLCWHVSDEALTRHLVWLSQQALMVFRRLTDPEPLDAKDGGTQWSRGTAALLRSLCRALALLLTRPSRGCTSIITVPDSVGSLLEIIFDSDACPLASLPRPLARAAVDTLRRDGFLRLTRMEALLGSPIFRSSRISRTGERKSTSAMENSPSKADVTHGFDFRAADSAFRRSWSMVASRVDQYIPYSLEMGIEEDGESVGTSPSDEGYDSNGEVYDWDNFSPSPCVGDRWTRVPDEVTLRVFSFMTPKRLSRLSCVNRAWRELLGDVSIWRPFFEARWALKSLKSEADLTGVSKMLLEAGDRTRVGERKHKRRRRYVVHWDVLAEGDEHVEPTRDWMALYRGRHRAELAIRGRFASRTSFPWMVCPFLGCVSYLKSEFAVKRHIQTHKPPRKARRRVRVRRLSAKCAKEADLNRDRILARSNYSGTSGANLRQDDVFGYELQLLLSGVCVLCVFFPFILGIKFVGRSSRGHTRLLIHLLSAAFLRRISRLLRVMVPGPLSLEAGCLVTVAGLLMARTSLDVVMLNLTTTIERAIVARDKGAFRGGMSRFARMCVPVAVVNSLLKYLQGELSLRFRQRLTAHVISKYMEGVTFYAVSNLDGRIANPDQAITQDIERFAESLADLYSNVTKPVLDIFVYVRSLSDKVDAVAPATMIGYLLLSGVALGALRKPTAAYTSLVAQQEGEYRYVNSRLLTNAQEIAFYKGNKKEIQVLSRVFDRLVCVTRRSERFRHSLGVLDSVVAKYFATIVGWTVVSRPFVNLDYSRHTQSTTAEVYQDYHSSGRMMLNLSSALGRLVLAGRELARLSGFSSRVTGLIDVIDNVNRGFYKRGRLPKGTENDLVDPSSAAAVTTPMPAAAEALAIATPPVRNAGVAGVNLATEHTPSWSKVKMETVQSETPSSAGTISMQVRDDDTPTAREAAGENEGSGLASSNGPRDDVAGFPRKFETEAFCSAVTGQPELAPEAGIARAGAEGGDEAQLAESPAVMGGGVLKRSGSVLLNEDSVIEFIDVPLVTPTGEVLIESLSFKVEAGMNVLIAGPNGSGKSSLFRVLGGLWPLAGGTLLKPPGSRLFYVPQRPYLALGTLRDQVIYPHTLEEAVGKGLTDETLLSILESVKLGYLLEREGGWDTVRDWTDVLSGGEKQRLALSRLFYHRPQFAILDECTSAVSVDVEGAIYRLAARSGITLFTVSHRKSLWEHHEYLLRFDGLGGYEFKPMSEVVSGERFGS